MITPLSLSQIGSPNPDAVRRELDRLGLTAEAAAGILRVSPRTVQRYLAPPDRPSHTPCPFPVFALLRLLNTSVSASLQRMDISPVSDP